MTGNERLEDWVHDLDLTDSDAAPPTPGKGIVLSMRGKEVVHQVQQITISTPPPRPPLPKRLYSPPGRYIPPDHRVVTCMAGRRVPRGKDAPGRAPKSGGRRATKPTRKETEVLKTLVPDMRTKSTPRRVAEHVWSKTDDTEMEREDRAKRRRTREEAGTQHSAFDSFRRGSTGRVILPPVSIDEISDEEAWLEDGSYYEDILEEEWRGHEAHVLRSAVDLFTEPGTCPFWTCREEGKTYTHNRFLRHLVEAHAAKHPVFGCKDDSACAVKGKGYQTTRRGHFVRHLMSTHAIGAEKGAGYIRDILAYPDRDNRPKGAYYPKHIFHREEERTDPHRLRLRKQAVVADPAVPETVGAAPEEEPVIQEAANTLVLMQAEPGSPLGPELLDAPIPSTSQAAGPVEGSDEPPVFLSSPTPGPVPGNDNSSDEGDNPGIATRLFMDHWDRAVTEVIKGFEEALSHTKKTAEVACSALRERNAALGKRVAILEADNRKLTEEGVLLRNEQEKERREESRVRHDLYYLQVKHASLEKRLEKWDRAFAMVTGMSLYDWDGSKEQLKDSLEK